MPTGLESIGRVLAPAVTGYAAGYRARREVEEKARMKAEERALAAQVREEARQQADESAARAYRGAVAKDLLRYVSSMDEFNNLMGWAESGKTEFPESPVVVTPGTPEIPAEISPPTGLPQPTIPTQTAQQARDTEAMIARFRAREAQGGQGAQGAPTPPTAVPSVPSVGMPPTGGQPSASAPQGPIFAPGYLATPPSTPPPSGPPKGVLPSDSLTVYGDPIAPPPRSPVALPPIPTPPLPGPLLAAAPPASPYQRPSSAVGGQEAGPAITRPSNIVDLISAARENKEREEREEATAKAAVLRNITSVGEAERTYTEWEKAFVRELDGGESDPDQMASALSFAQDVEDRLKNIAATTQDPNAQREALAGAVRVRQRFDTFITTRYGDNPEEAVKRITLDAQRAMMTGTLKDAYSLSIADSIIGRVGTDYITLGQYLRGRGIMPNLDMNAVSTAISATEGEMREYAQGAQRERLGNVRATAEAGRKPGGTATAGEGAAYTSLATAIAEADDPLETLTALQAGGADVDPVLLARYNSLTPKEERSLWASVADVAERTRDTGQERVRRLLQQAASMGGIPTPEGAQALKRGAAEALANIRAGMPLEQMKAEELAAIGVNDDDNDALVNAYLYNVLSSPNWEEGLRAISGTGAPRATTRPGELPPGATSTLRPPSGGYGPPRLSP